jgi:hypothetical protein
VIGPSIMNSEMTATILAAGVERAGEKEYADAVAQRNAMKDNIEKAAINCFTYEQLENRDSQRTFREILK